jgi:hypothetical protein
VATPVPAHHFVALDWRILPPSLDLAHHPLDFAIVLVFLFFLFVFLFFLFVFLFFPFLCFFPCAFEIRVETATAGD